MIALQTRVGMEERVSTRWPRTTAIVRQDLTVLNAKTVRIRISRFIIDVIFYVFILFYFLRFHFISISCFFFELSKLFEK